uniref:Uncharacterized protein n=1 Tax=viral metagenome TaxID=1070528 RepID=A0A6M3Y0P1_9ZZZZ
MNEKPTEEDEDEETEEWEIIEAEEPKTTEITTESKEKVDYTKCPYCGSYNIGKDTKYNIYVCYSCKKTYLWD